MDINDPIVLEVKAQAHPLANVFPLMVETGEEGFKAYSSLKQSLHDYGQLEPIITHQGQWLDGRNRGMCCYELNITPKFVEYTGRKEDIPSFIWNKNAERRHLTPSQRAAIYIKFYDAEKEEIQHRAEERRLSTLKQGMESPLAQNYANGKGKSAKFMADRSGVSQGTMESALRVQREAPELLEDAAIGWISIGQALKEIESQNVPPIKAPKSSDAVLLSKLENIRVNIKGFKERLPASDIIRVRNCIELVRSELEEAILELG